MAAQPTFAPRLHGRAMQAGQYNLDFSGSLQSLRNHPDPRSRGALI